jgi:ubiquitin C-terminal hydrolase
MSNTSPPFRGVVNTGASCYLNSLIQALSALSAVHEWVRNATRDGKSTLAASLSLSMSALAFPTGGSGGSGGGLLLPPIRLPPSLISAFPAKGEQDAHEALILLAETIGNNTTSRGATTPAKTTNTASCWFDAAATNGCKSLSRVDAIIAAASSALVTTRTVLSPDDCDPFLMKIARRISCNACTRGGSAWRMTEERVLTVIPNSGGGGETSIRPLIARALSSGARVDWLCDFCGARKASATMMVELIKSPRVLCVHVARALRLAHPDRTRVTVPLTLSLAGAAAAAASPPTPFVFELASLIEHHGTGNGHGGHFTTIRRVPYCKATPPPPRRLWALANDSSVSFLTPESNAFTTTGVYLAFYTVGGTADALVAVKDLKGAHTEGAIAKAIAAPAPGVNPLEQALTSILSNDTSFCKDALNVIV